MKKIIGKRALSLLLSAALLITQMGVPVFAQAAPPDANGLCEHHTEHTTECGYTEGAPCTHEHTEDCYRTETVCTFIVSDEVDVSENTATPSEPPEQTEHECTEESGCITKTLDCKHTHDEACGFTEPSPCTYKCEICAATDSGDITIGVSSITVTGFDELEEAVRQRTVSAGTERDKLNLPTTLQAQGYEVSEDTAVVDSGTVPVTTPAAITIEGVTWELDPTNEVNNGISTYDPTQGSYAFTPVLPENCTLVDGIALPEIWVRVGGVNLLANSQSYNINESSVTIDDSCTGGSCPGHTITGTREQTANTITVTGGTHQITIENINISVGGTAFSLQGTAVVNLTLTGENALSSGWQSSGVYVPGNTAITIDGSGHLNVTGQAGNNDSMGIGGSNSSSGTITIKSGTITATGGIGGKGSSVTIDGGTVTANGDFIGTGIGGDGSTVTINEGAITATGGGGAAGIGGNPWGAANTVTIHGGTIEAKGGEGTGYTGGGPGIGCANNNITISGGTVTATGGNGVAQPSGLGGGRGIDGIVTISGGQIEATGGKGSGYNNGVGNGGAGIGGSNTTITGGTVASIGGDGGRFSDNSGKSGAGIAGSAFSTGTSGNAVIITTNISDQSYTSNVGTQGVIIVGDSGIVYGSPTPAVDFEIPSGKTLTIAEAKSLTLGSGVTLTNRGTITVNGTLDTSNGVLNNFGTINGGGTTTGDMNEAKSTITLEVSPSPATYGEQVTLTATIAADTTRQARSVPTNTVIFYCDGVKLGEQIVASNKVELAVTLDTLHWKAGDHKLTATYTGGSDDKFLPSTSSEVALTVNRAAQSAPSVPTLGGKTDTSVTLNTVNGQKYIYTAENSKPATITGDWKTAIGSTFMFDGLTPGTSYYFWTCIPENDYYNVSEVPEALQVNTIGNPKTFNISEASVTIDDSCGTAYCPGHTITGTSTANTVTVSGGTHDIILNGVSIDVSSTNKACAFELQSAGVCTITLFEGSRNTLRSGPDRPGIFVPANKKLAIKGSGSLEAYGGASWPGIGRHGGTGDIEILSGTVTATGGSQAAGIGGSWGGAGGTITINGGTVTATGGIDGAGIGGGFQGAGGTITINSGTVTATGGSNGGAGIGGGVTGQSGTFSTGETGNAFLMTNSISDKTSQADWSGVIFENQIGKVYQTPTVAGTVEIPENALLTIPKGTSATFSGTVTNRGVVYVVGTLTLSEPGTWTNETDGAVYKFSEGKVTNVAHTTVTGATLVPVGDFTVTGGTMGTDYNYVDNTLTILKETALTITGTTTKDKIVVPTDVTANITLNDVNIDVNTQYGPCAFALQGTAKVNLTLIGTSTLKSGTYMAGLGVSADAALTITDKSTGSLTAAGNQSAGIGGGGGTITINGGTVTATGSNGGAGIGDGTTGNITINGGTVTAKSSGWGAGIGGDGSIAITINGGTVTATGRGNGAGIGGDRSTITINGGTVAATSGGNGAGIGGTFSTDENGKAVIITSKISDTSYTSNGGTQGVIIVGDSGKVYGSPTPTEDFEIPAGKTLTIDSGKTLTIPNGVTLTNNGTINIESGGELINNGTVTNNGTIINKGTITGSIGGTAPLEKSATVVTFAIKGTSNTPVTTAEYGQTIVITATAQKDATVRNRAAAVDRVGFYLGDASTGVNLGTGNVTSNGGISTATLEIALTDNKWTPSGTPYTITADFGGATGLQGSIGTGTLTVNSGTQDIVNSPAVGSQTATSVTLTHATPGGTGTGALKYGYATSDSSGVAGNWQTGLAFTGLTPNTQYYFFAKREADSNYKEAISTSLSVKTGMGTQSVTTAIGYGETSFTYGDAAQELVDTPAFNPSGTITYGSSDSSVVSVATDGKITFVKTGKATITATNTVANYDDKTSTVEITVTPAELTVTAKNHAITYGKAPANDGVTYSRFVNGESASDLTGMLAYDYSYTQYDNVGSYTITPKGYNEGNYKITYVTGTLAVEQMDVGLTWANTSNRKYGDGKTITATATGTVNSDTITVTVSGGDKTAVGGTYTATATGLTGSKAGNYKLPSSKTTTYSIGKADALNLSGSATMIKNQSNYKVELDLTKISSYPTTPGGTPAFSITSNTTNGLTSAAVNGSTLTLIADNTNNGTADTVTVKVSGMGNYEDSTITITVTYTDKTPVTITGVTAASNLTYSGQPQQGYTGTPTSAYTGEYEISYASTGGAGYASTTAPTNAGSYTVTFKVPDSSAAYSGSAEVNFTIGKKAATVKPESKSVKKGEAIPNFNLVYEGVVNNETLTPSIVPTFTCTASDTNTAGDYTITWSNKDSVGFGDAAKNYDITKLETATLSIAEQLYMLTIEGGGSGVTGSGSHASGSTVSINAGTKSGYTFTGWAGSVTFADKSKAETTFTMPEQNVTITAKWSYNGGGSDDTPSYTPPTVITPPATPEQPNPPTNGETKLPGKVEGGNATVTVPDKNITDAINAAKKQAGQNGISVTVNIQLSQTANSLTATISKAALDKLIAENVKELKITSSLISYAFNLDALKEMQKSVVGNLTIVAAKQDVKKLSKDAQAAIDNRPVFDFTMQSGGKAITNFGKGNTSVWIPYTLQKNEVSGNVQAVYVDAAGKVQWIPGSSYDAGSKTLMFTTNHFSVYGVGYKQDVPKFADIRKHWAKADMEFVAARGLMSGTSTTTFSPDTGMTRGMFVTALGRLAGIDVNSYKIGKFTDVAATAYYAPYVNWAAQKGITGGTTATTFSPDKTITRQELATLMANYAKAMNYPLPKTRTAVTYADNGSIGSWAAEAVKAMQMAGVMNGKDGNKFDPTGTATRAEVSAVLHRYVELVVDPATAQGLDVNDSGKIVYYENGKLLVGTKTIDGTTYHFGSDGICTRIDAVVPETKKYITHKIVYGDTLWDLSRKYKCTVAEIIGLNSMKDPNSIKVGTEIKIPQK